MRIYSTQEKQVLIYVRQSSIQISFQTLALDQVHLYSVFEFRAFPYHYLRNVS